MEEAKWDSGEVCRRRVSVKISNASEYFLKLRATRDCVPPPSPTNALVFDKIRIFLQFKVRYHVRYQSTIQATSLAPVNPLLAILNLR